MINKIRNLTFTKILAISAVLVLLGHFVLVTFTIMDFARFLNIFFQIDPLNYYYELNR